MDQKELMTEINKTVADSIEKALPELVEDSVTNKFSKLEEKTFGEIEEIKSEIKKFNVAKNQISSWDESFARKTAVVSIFKDCIKTRPTESQFKSIVEKTIKTMNEWTATEWAELVFDQFERDVLRVINSYTVVSNVRILTIAKGDKINLPKANNSLSTTYTNEAATYTASDAETLYVTIDIAKMTTLVNMTEELLDDTMTIPDLYDLIVEFIGESQAEFLETQLIKWVGDVKWITVNANVNEVALAATETSANIDDTALVDVITKAPLKFKRRRERVKWFMSQYVMGKIKALKTADWYPLYPELRNETPTLMGYEVVLSDIWWWDWGLVQNATEDVANAVLLFFGDLSYYTMVRRKGLTFTQGYYWDRRAQDIMSLKANQRWGGTLTFPEAITVLTNWPVA